MPILAKLVNIILPLGVLLVCFQSHKEAWKIILGTLFICFLRAFQIVLLYLFGEAIIAVDMFLNLINTNPNEAFELLNNLWPGMVFVIIVYVPSLILAIQSIRKKNAFHFISKKAKKVGIKLHFSRYSVAHSNVYHFTTSI